MNERAVNASRDPLVHLWVYKQLGAYSAHSVVMSCNHMGQHGIVFSKKCNRHTNSVDQCSHSLVSLNYTFEIQYSQIID